MTSSWLAAVQSAWHWWRDGIAALLPQSMRGRLAGDTPIVAIDMGGDAVRVRRFAKGRVAAIAEMPRTEFGAVRLRTALSNALAKPWFLKDSFALRLPLEAALTRTLSLPFAARRNIASLLDIELDRQSPLDRSEIYHDYRILNSDPRSGRIDIVWRIVRRSSVAPALDICRQAGVALAVVAFIDDDAPPDGGNFPVDARAAALLRLRRWLVPALAMLVLILCVAVTMGAYSRNQDALDAYTARVDQMRLAARGALHLEHEIAATRAHTAFLLREKRRPTVTQILAETTRRLPDSSWITDFAYHDGEVRVRGSSNVASSLLALFDASDLFTAAQFGAPLTQSQDPTQEKFDLTFDVRAGGR